MSDWGRYEPVRTVLYGLLGPVVALLVFYGVVADEAAVLWIALGTAVLGGAGVELARAQVTPMSKLNEPAGL